MFDSSLSPSVQPSLLTISRPCASRVEFWRKFPPWHRHLECEGLDSCWKSSVKFVFRKVNCSGSVSQMCALGSFSPCVSQAHWTGNIWNSNPEISHRILLWWAPGEREGWWENNLLCPLWERSLLSEKATCTSLTHSTNNSRHPQTWNLPAKWLSPEKNAFLPLDTVKNHKSTHWKSPFDAFRSAVILITSWRNYPKLIHAKGHFVFWFVFVHSELCSEPLCTLWDLQGLGRN